LIDRDDLYKTRYLGGVVREPMLEEYVASLDPTQFAERSTSAARYGGRRLTGTAQTTPMR
jgi:hypothetical protein